MESPRVGIIILVLVAMASLAGGLAGWKLRHHAKLFVSDINRQIAVTFFENVTVDGKKA